VIVHLLITASQNEVCGVFNPGKQLHCDSWSR
jgi:hypothetical protein